MTLLWRVCWSLSPADRSPCAPPDAALKAAYDSHRWFALREAVAKGIIAPVPFYIAALESAFHQDEGFTSIQKNAWSSFSGNAIETYPCKYNQNDTDFFGAAVEALRR